MIEPELFDVIELLVNLPEYNFETGVRGAIVDCYPDGKYEVEFTNEEGETEVLCPLSSNQFIVVWKAKTESWLSVSEQIVAAIGNLSEERKREVLDFTRALYKK
ncbi:DUF4926 domain-containing protein [Trichocoleus sp. FACHB-90]|uniref:DUF4926 domain-containing protein n=1 Tax=Cyanophyceae TaxID=3028117 RepID=UPI0016821230|nr:DUF4926 domain-containing protein [Trichocoleus sp. FACHB-90]MBD1925433.1 DUF4926 domain-containing protein [Trichocoleus sp. FACHB-90]